MQLLRELENLTLATRTGSVEYGVEFKNGNYHRTHRPRASRFGGMEWWNGTVEWNSGMVEYWNGGVTTPTVSVFGRSLPTESIQRKG